MRRPTPLDRITREGRPKNLGNRHRARPGGKQRHHPARRPSLSGVQAERIDMSGRNVDVPPGLHGKTARNFREHVIAYARPATDGPRRSPDLRVFLISYWTPVPRLRTSPFQMTHAACSPPDTAKRPRSLAHPRRRRAFASGAHMPPLRGRFRRGLSDESRARSLSASRPARAAPRRSPAFQIFTLRQSLPPPSPMDKAKESAAVGDSHRRLHISLLRTSPLPDDARRFPPQNDANPPGAPKNRRRQSSAARNGACSPLRRVFRLGLSDESRHLLPRFRPCTATHAPQLCLTESLRHTVFWKVLPKSCLFLLHGAFSMYIFSRIKNKTPLRSKRNNVNERIGLITGMI